MTEEENRTTGDEPNQKSEEQAGGDPGKSRLPADVEGVMGKHARVARLFAGVASGIAPDGRKLDGNNNPVESYDLAFVAALVHYHVRDINVLDAALKLRPGNARSDNYVADIISRALPRPDSTGDAEAEGHAFAVEDVTVFDGDPPTFTFAIKVGDGVAIAITFDSGQLIDPGRFRARCFEKLRVFVALPNDWRETIEAWMASARVVTPPDEGTRDGSLARAVRRAIGRLSIGASLDDLHDGRGVLATKRGKPVVLFEIEAVMAALRTQDSKPEVEEVTQALLKIGAKHGRRMVRLASTSLKTPACWEIKAPKDLVAAFAPAIGGNVIPLASAASARKPPKPATSSIAVNEDDEDVIA